MFRRSKACCLVICDDPRGCGRLFMMLIGTLCTFMLGIIIFACIGLYECITGKDYLSESKQCIPEKEEGDREKEV
jgi:hypothetical protein